MSDDDIIVGPLGRPTVHFNLAYVVTLPNGDRLTIPAGSTAVEVAPCDERVPSEYREVVFGRGSVSPEAPAPLHVCTDPAALAWAKNEIENDERRAAFHRQQRVRACATDVTGEVGFNAYGGAGPNPWMTWNGQPMPRWPDLGYTVEGKITCERWRVAALSEIAAYLERLTAAGFIIVRATPPGG